MVPPTPPCFLAGEGPTTGSSPVFVSGGYQEGLEHSWETVRGYRYILNYLEDYFTAKYNGPVYLDDITIQDLDEYIYNMGSERNWKPNSVKKCHYALSSFFAYCTRKELCQKDISRNMEPVKGERKERTYLSKEEFLELAAAIDHPIIQVIWGLRATWHWQIILKKKAISGIIIRSAMKSRWGKSGMTPGKSR